MSVNQANDAVKAQRLFCYLCSMRALKYQDVIKKPAKRVGTRVNPDGSESTHLYATETLDGETWFSFPTLFQNPDGSWIDMSEGPWEDAYEEAKRRGEVIDFGRNKQEALDWGMGSWKTSAIRKNK